MLGRVRLPLFRSCIASFPVSGRCPDLLGLGLIQLRKHFQHVLRLLNIASPAIRGSQI